MLTLDLTHVVHPSSSFSSPTAQLTAGEEVPTDSESDDDVPNQTNPDGGYNFQLANHGSTSGIDNRGFKRQTSNWDTRGT